MLFTTSYGFYLVTKQGKKQAAAKGENDGCSHVLEDDVRGPELAGPASTS